ncbi:MAG: SRPBCC family protein [Streptosporangiaceae bacterium]
MQLTSAIRISRPAPEVLAALLDAGTVAACLPGSRLIGEVADNTYAGELRLRIGPMHAVYAGTVRLDNADRDAGTATLHASGWEQGGQGRADASVTLRVESRGGSTRVLISADLMIRGKVAEYAPGAIGDVGQRLVEQFAGNVEQLLATQASATQASATQASATQASATQASATQAGRRAPPAGPPRWTPPRPDKRTVAATALLLAGGALAAGALALAVWRRRHPDLSPLPDTPWYISHEGARHG